MKKVAALPIPVACAGEMQEVVRRVETAFAWLNRVATEHANASRLLPKLDQAILAKAFRGELVPQDQKHVTSA
jgi:type I restriction enzyme S subunit